MLFGGWFRVSVVFLFGEFCLHNQFKSTMSRTGPAMQEKKAMNSCCLSPTNQRPGIHGGRESFGCSWMDLCEGRRKSLGVNASFNLLGGQLICHGLQKAA